MSFPEAKQAWPSSYVSISTDDFLAGGGRIGEMIRHFDWAATSLGPIKSWPLSLKITMRMVLASRQPMCFWWGPDLLKFYNEAYEPILGLRKDKALGRPFAEIWADVWDGVLPYVRSALAGTATWEENMPLVMTRNGFAEQTYWTFSYSPLYGDDGAVHGLLNIVTETTQAVLDRQVLETRHEETRQHLRQKEAYEQELRLLNGELAHRVKNMLAMVQSIVGQTMRSAQSLPQAASQVSARIQALPKAQDLLTGKSVASADIAEVVENAIDPHRDSPERFQIIGPSSMQASSRQALGLSLALHELATNATKYGSLSVTAGQVEVEWGNEDGRFFLRWSERGGPPVSEPQRRGFGSKLTERVVADLFRGEAKIDFAPDGVVFVLRGQLDQVAGTERSRSAE
ncbi:HWE histidine kinase domain-containing protein [Agrobacterium vitis]|uniref:HWE histidine kinase domain-containing protein n=1 Tax=Agrobacterium vitis TaxID=373 RepID=UPI0020365160|nr:HWE histidine kinase domain-containing protein [Agrobacterium vitis]